MPREARRLLAVLALMAGLTLAACGGGGTVRAAGPGSLSLAVRPLQAGQVVDSVPCLPGEMPAYHSHAHLAAFVDGSQVAIPAGIGVGRPWGVDASGFVGSGGCFSWLHTHDASGVVHIVAPEPRTFTLGQLFAVWGQPLGSGGALGYRGPVRAFVNGRAVSGDPASIPLTDLANVVLELGRPPSSPPPATYDFASARA